MNSSMNFRGSWRLALAACSLLIFASVTAAQDTDDDGALPAHQNTGNSDASTPEAVGLSAPAGSVDMLESTAARLSISAETGPTELDTTVAPSDAMFAATALVHYEISEAAIVLQGDGQLVLPGGYDVQFQAAPTSVARVALFVVHSADASLQDLLSGAAPASFVVPIGDLPSVDLGMVQQFVTNHAGALPDLAVSLVYASLDAYGGLHISAARMATDASPIEIAIH